MPLPWISIPWTSWIALITLLEWHLFLDWAERSNTSFGFSGMESSLIPDPQPSYKDTFFKPSRSNTFHSAHGNLEGRWVAQFSSSQTPFLMTSLTCPCWLSWQQHNRYSLLSPSKKTDWLPWHSLVVSHVRANQVWSCFTFKFSQGFQSFFKKQQLKLAS